MKKIFVKNLYQILSFALTTVVIIFPILCIPIFTGFSNKIANTFTLYSISILILLFFLIGFYWIFQTVEITENGITVYFFAKILRNITWDEVEGIFTSSAMKNPVYTIKTIKGKNLNLDKRKSIKRVLEIYALNKMNC